MLTTCWCWRLSWKGVYVFTTVGVNPFWMFLIFWISVLVFGSVLLPTAVCFGLINGGADEWNEWNNASSLSSFLLKMKLDFCGFGLIRRGYGPTFVLHRLCFLGNMLGFIFIFPTTQQALCRHNNPSRPQQWEREHERVHTDSSYFYEFEHSAACKD